jgi:hypothetical protein
MSIDRRPSNRQRVQDVDRVDHVQALTEPARRSCMRVQDTPFRIVQRAKKLDRLVRNRRRWGNVRQNPSVRAPELELAVGQSLEPIALLMHRAVVAAA